MRIYFLCYLLSDIQFEVILWYYISGISKSVSCCLLGNVRSLLNIDCIVVMDNIV